MLKIGGNPQKIAEENLKFTLPIKSTTPRKKKTQKKMILWKTVDVILVILFHLQGRMPFTTLSSSLILRQNKLERLSVVILFKAVQRPVL